MNQPPRPAYWQLDIFMIAMIGLMVAVVRAHLSSRWEIGAEIMWAALMIAGMSMWVYANWAALKHAEAQDRAAAGRRVPLTPVQKRYLAVIKQRDRVDQIDLDSK
jgi:hypothetical protein